MDELEHTPTLYPAKISTLQYHDILLDPYRSSLFDCTGEFLRRALIYLDLLEHWMHEFDLPA